LNVSSPVKIKIKKKEKAKDVFKKYFMEQLAIFIVFYLSAERKNKK